MYVDSVYADPKRQCIFAPLSDGDSCMKTKVHASKLLSI